jgi:hypothetical protein
MKKKPAGPLLPYSVAACPVCLKPRCRRKAHVPMTKPPWVEEYERKLSQGNKAAVQESRP